MLGNQIKEKEISKIQESIDLLNVKKIDLEAFDKLSLQSLDNIAQTYLIKDKTTGNLYEASELFIDHFDFLNAIKIYSQLNNPLIQKLIGYSLYNFEHKPNLICITEHAQNTNLSRIIDDIDQGISINTNSME